MIVLIVRLAFHYVRVEARTLDIAAPDRLSGVHAGHVVIDLPVAWMHHETHHFTRHRRVLHRPTLQASINELIIYELCGSMA